MCGLAALVGYSGWMSETTGEFTGYFDDGSNDPITYFDEPMPLGTIEVAGEEFEVRVTAYAKRADGAIGMMVEAVDEVQRERLKQLTAKPSE